MNRLRAWFAKLWGTPKPPDPVYTRSNPPPGMRWCSTCDKFISNELKCDYSWDGRCSVVGGFDWRQDSAPVRSGKGTLLDNHPRYTERMK